MDLTELSIGERVGRGGTGTVHRATWKSPVGGVPVAVKFLAGTRKVGADAAFLREARAAARLSHPNVVTLLDAGRVPDPNAASEPGIPYLVLEWVDGQTIRAAPPTSWDETARLVRELLDALAHAHGWEVLHRDIKPANIMRTPEGVARLMDFGVGRVLDDPLGGEQGRSRRIVGTPRYMAPEQVLAEWRDEGPWTDIYGLAALVFELVSGRPVFDGDDASVLVAHARERPPKLEPRFAVPYGLRNWIYTALEKRPRDRFRSAAEARAALEDMDDSERTSRYPVVTPGSATANVATVLTVPQRHAHDDRAVSSELRAAGAGLFGMREPPIVGREAEKEQMWNAFRRVSRLDRAEALIIRGDGGTGKTALARWLARRAREGGYAAVLRSSHDAEVAGEAALTGALKQWFRIEGLAVEDALDRVSSELESLGFEDAAIVALDFVTRCFPELSHRRRLQDEDDWHRFLLEFAQRIGEGAPTLWIIDDVHASEASTRFVEVAAEAEFGLLLVVTTRSTDALTIRRAYELEVGPLRDASMRELVQAMLPLEPSLTDGLVQRAQGSPMFATQLLGDWVSRDILQPGPLGYRAPVDALEGVPDDVHAVWSARVGTALDELGEGARVGLQLAAVLGTRARLDEWRHACMLCEIPDPEPLLEALAPYGLVRVEGHELELAHGLLRESILRDIDDSRVFDLAAANAVARLSTTPRGLERAARHFWAAGENLRALDHLYDAIVQYDVAEEHDAVILCVPLLEEWAAASGEEDNLYLAAALARLARVCEHRAGPESARAARERAERIVFADASADDLVRAPVEFHNEVASAVLIAYGLEAMEQEPARALEIFRDGYRVAAAGGCVANAIQAASMQGDCLAELGRIEEAYEVLETAFSSLPRTELTPRVAFHADQRRADMCQLRGDYRGAIGALRSATERAEALGDRELLAYAYTRRGDMHAYAGELDEARQWTERARALYADIGSWVQQLHELTLVIFDALDGRGARLRERAHHLLVRFHDESLRRYIALATMLAATCEAAAGNPEASAKLLERAIELARVRVVPETPMLAVALAEAAQGELRETAIRFAREHHARLPPVYAARLEAIA